MPPSALPWQCLNCQLAQLVITPTKRAFSTSFARRNRKPAFPNVKASAMGLIPTTTHTGPTSTKPYTEQEKELLGKKYSAQQMKTIQVGEDAIPAEDLMRQGLQRTDPNRIAYYDDFSTMRPVLDYSEEEMTGPEALSKAQIKYTDEHKAGADPDGIEPSKRRLMQQTGLTSIDIDRLKTKNLVRHRVVNQTRMGKISSQYYLTIAGNGKGMLGIGEGKSAEDADAAKQALYAAVRNMKPIPRYEERTIYGDVEAKVSATVVQLQARPPGFGNRCQHLIFEMARAAGIHDIAARTPRSRNKMNVVKAAYAALLSQRLPEDVARARGKKFVDVRKVYYGASVN